MRGSRTPAREALLRAEYPEATDAAALMARVNALPGQPFRTRSAFRTYAASLGLRKSADALDVIFAPARSAGGRAVTERLTGAAIRAGLRIWTQERIALLREEYPTATDKAALLGRLNALPGPPIASGPSVNTKALRLGLRQTRETYSAIHSARALHHAEAGRVCRAHCRTPERAALMQARYAAETDAAALLADLNALPGPPLPNAEAMAKWAYDLRIRKSPEALAAILRRGVAALNAAALSPERQARRQANAAARAARKEAKRAADRAAKRAAKPPPPPKPPKPPKTFVAPRAPEMRKRAIPPPVAREPAPPPPPPSSADLADQSVLRKQDMARRMIAKKREAAQIAQTCALPLREVFRLVGEMRMERDEGRSETAGHCRRRRDVRAGPVLVGHHAGRAAVRRDAG